MVRHGSLTGADMTSRDPDLLEFKPLHTYKPPSMPTEEAIRRLLRQLGLGVPC